MFKFVNFSVFRVTELASQERRSFRMPYDLMRQSVWWTSDESTRAHTLELQAVQITTIYLIIWINIYYYYVSVMVLFLTV